MIVWVSHSQPPKHRSPLPNFTHPGTGQVEGDNYWEWLSPFLLNKELKNVKVWGFTMAWVPHSQALKSRSKDRERGTHYQEWFCPFLDNELLNNVCDNLEVHNCLSAPLLIPQIQEFPSHTQKSRDKDMDWWTCYQEQLSPFLNDEKLNNVGEDLWVHKGLDVPFSTSLCPRKRGRDGGIPY